MSEFVENASKALKIAEKIVNIIKTENLSEEETMTVLNLVDISLFPGEYDEAAIEADIMSQCPCTLLENLLIMDICDGDCGNCKVLTESDDFEGCEDGCGECGGCHDACEHKNHEGGHCGGCDCK